MPTKKRSAPGPGSKSGNMPLPTRPGVRDNLPQRRSEELGRGPGGAIRRDAAAPHRASFDSVGMQAGGMARQGFAGNLQELLPLDVSMASASPDSSGTSGGIHQHPQGFQQGGGANSSASSLYKLDAMMFPSADPFAYPNQPLLDASGYPQARPASHSGPGQAQDAQYYMSNVYDDIEGQLLGPIPPYLVSQGHTMGPASQMYNTADMLAMQQGHAGAHQHQQRQQQQQRHRHQQEAQLQRRPQQDMMEDVLVDPSFQGNWDDILGNPNYR